MEMKEIIDLCRRKNATIDGMMAREGITLDDWIEGERAKLTHNMSLPVIAPRDDFIDVCAAYMEEHFGKEAGQNAAEILSGGSLYTGDHLGGLYSAQSFQGDLCYMRMLKKAGGSVPCVPMVSFGLVPLISSTFARGLIAYGRTKEAEHFPIFPYAPAGATATQTESYTADMMRSTRDKVVNEGASYLVKKKVRQLMDSLFLRKDILAKTRYADQIVLLGKGIYDSLSLMTQQSSIYHMEAEELFANLFIKDYAQKDGLLRQLLSDPSMIRILNETTDAEGRCFADLLFRGLGTDKRCFPLRLFPDGYLRGEDLQGNPAAYPADEASLTQAVRERKIMPHIYLSWLMSGFMRGFSWYGGVLQSQYLPHWNERTCEMLSRAGFGSEAKLREAYDGSGYLSGPVYLLFDTGDGAVNAGPLECMVKTPDAQRLDELYRTTDIRSAHEMGMFEFYNDLLLPNEKKEGWYETIAIYCKQHYASHTLQSLQTA